MDGTTWGALAAGAAGLLTAVFTFITTRNRNKVELTLSERDAFNKEQVVFRAELRAEILRLRTDIDEMSEDLSANIREVRRLRSIIDHLEEEILEYRQILRQHGIPLPTRRPIKYYDEAYMDTPETTPHPPRPPETPE